MPQTPAPVHLPARAMTGLAGEIESVIGTHLATALLAQRGGTTITVPVTATGSTMAFIIGQDATDAMIAHFGHGRLDLPLSAARGTGAARHRGWQMLAGGASLKDVALVCEVHERTVSRWKQAMRDGRSI